MESGIYHKVNGILSRYPIPVVLAVYYFIANYFKA